MNKKIKTLISFATLTLFLLPPLAQAQGDPGGGVPDDPGTVPIDGGVSLLVGAGVAYGIKKLKDNKAKQK